MEKETAERISRREVQKHIGLLLSHALIFMNHLNEIEDDLKVIDLADGPPLPRPVCLGEDQLAYVFLNVWETVVRTLVRAGEEVLGTKLKWRYPRHWQGRPLADDARELVKEQIRMLHFAHLSLEAIELPQDNASAATCYRLKVKMKSQIQELIGRYVELGGIEEDLALVAGSESLRSPQTEFDLAEAPF